MKEINDSILIIDKPLDWTSNDVLTVLKKEFNVPKAGHAGTLDPKATGVLIVCTGKMTKRINEFMDMDKEYTGTIKIGATTESYDTERKEENIKEVISISDEDIEEARKEFTGKIQQLPPMHSAVKHKGKPLYKLARKGEEVIRMPREVNISEFDLKRVSERELIFRVVCSKGTYIRSLANDIGEKLRTGGYLKELRRTKIGDYSTEDLDCEFRGIKYKAVEL